MYTIIKSMGFRYRYTCERIVVPPVQRKHLTSLHLSSLLRETAHFDSYITGWVCGYNATMQSYASTGTCSTCLLLSLTWISCDHDFSQHIPTQYLYLLADKYFHNKHSQFEIRNRFLDLLGDVFFVVPGLVTARCHRGESLSFPTPSLQGHSVVGLLAAGILAAC